MPTGADPDILFGGPWGAEGAEGVSFGRGCPLRRKMFNFWLEIVHFGVHSDMITHAVRKAYRTGYKKEKSTIKWWIVTKYLLLTNVFSNVFIL